MLIMSSSIKMLCQTFTKYEETKLYRRDKTVSKKQEASYSLDVTGCFED